MRTNDAVLISYVEALLKEARITPFRRRPQHEHRRRLARHPAAPHHGRAGGRGPREAAPDRRRIRQRAQLMTAGPPAARRDARRLPSRPLPPRPAGEGRAPGRRRRDDPGERGAGRLRRTPSPISAPAPGQPDWRSLHAVAAARVTLVEKSPVMADCAHAASPTRSMTRCAPRAELLQADVTLTGRARVAAGLADNASTSPS